MELLIILTGVVRFLRDVPPAHYSLKVESFSRLAHSGERYVSSKFDASGYTWYYIFSISFTI